MGCGRFGNVSRLNSKLDRMICLAQDIVSYAAKNKIEDRGSFVKQTFKPDFDIKTLNRLHASNIIEVQHEKKLVRIYIYSWMNTSTPKKKGEQSDHLCL